MQAVRTRQKAAQTREALLEAAAQVFSDKGYHDANVSDIVAAIGKAQGSFYNHFANKRAIFAELLSSFAERIVAEIDGVDLEAIHDQATYSIAGMKLGTAISTIFLEEQRLARIFLWETPGLDHEFAAIVDDTYRRATAGTQAFIERGRQVGIIRADLPSKLMAATMVGMCTHLITRYLRGDFGEFDPAELLQTLVSVNLRGILK